MPVIGRDEFAGGDGVWVGNRSAEVGGTPQRFFLEGTGGLLVCDGGGRAWVSGNPGTIGAFRLPDNSAPAGVTCLSMVEVKNQAAGAGITEWYGAFARTLKTGSITTYAALWFEATGVLQLYKLAVGSATPLGAGTVLAAPTAGNSILFGLQCNGSTIELLKDLVVQNDVVVGGTVVETITDTSYAHSTSRTTGYGGKVGSSGTAGNYRLQKFISQDEILVPYGPATKLAFQQQPPASVAAGTPFQLAVEVQDANGAKVGNSTATVALDPSVTAHDALVGGTRSVAAVNGLATFPDVTIRGWPLAGEVLLASSAGLAGATANAVTTTAPTIGGGVSIRRRGARFMSQALTLGDAKLARLRFRLVDASGNGVGGITGKAQLSKNDGAPLASTNDIAAGPETGDYYVLVVAGDCGGLVAKDTVRVTLFGTGVAEVEEGSGLVFADDYTAAAPALALDGTNHVIPADAETTAIIEAANITATATVDTAAIVTALLNDPAFTGLISAAAAAQTASEANQATLSIVGAVVDAIDTATTSIDGKLPADTTTRLAHLDADVSAVTANVDLTPVNTALANLDALVTALGATVDGVDTDVSTLLTRLPSALNIASGVVQAALVGTQATALASAASGAVDLTPVNASLAALGTQVADVMLQLSPEVEWERAPNSAIGYYYQLDPASGVRTGFRRQVDYASATSSVAVRLGPLVAYA